MAIFNQFAEALADKPEFLKSSDLIEIGLFGSFSDVCWATKRGHAPPNVRLAPRKIRYPKSQLISWLLERQNKKNEEDVQ